MQSRKSLLAKIFGFLSAGVCTLALSFSLVACAGETGAQGEQGPQGPQGEQGLPGQDGEDGQDGLTPSIGENGNWWIGDTDTGIPAQGTPGQDGEDGEDGLTPYIGENGNWWIGDTDTGVPASGSSAGQDGEDGLTPHIGENGNWWIGDTDTGIPARGQDGEDGLTPYIGENGNWWIGDTDTGISAMPAGQTCEHDYVYVFTVKDATCYETGLDLYVCSNNCGSAILEEVPTTEHDWETVTVPADCENDGYTYDKCTICGDESEHRDIVPALGHDLSEVVVEPTCTQDGEKYQVCSRCDYETEHEVLPATGHTWIEDTPVVMPGGTTICEDGGFVARYCSVCGAVETVRIDPTGHHSENWEVTLEPTLESVGVLSGTCVNCGNYESIEIPALNAEDYTYEVTVEKESCSDTGYATYTIVVDKQEFSFEVTLEPCDHTLLREDGTTELIDDDIVYLLGDYPEFTLTGNAGELTCASTGVQAWFECDECGEIIIVNVRIAHSEPEDATEQVIANLGALPEEGDMQADVIYVVEASCEEGGYRAYLCGVCGELDIVETQPLGHDYRYEIVQEEGENGPEFTVIETCSRCDYYAEMEADSVEVVTNEATCEAPGSIVYTVTFGDTVETFTEVIPQEDHKLHREDGSVIEIDDSLVYDILEYPELTITGNAGDITCSDEGVLAWFQCADCGQVITVSVVYPHTVPAGAEEVVLEELPYDGDLELIAADAENQIAANTVYTFAATCEDAGYTIYRCAVCGDVQIEVIAQLGHDYVYSLEYDEEEGTYTFVAVCANDESHTFSIVLDEESDLTIVENQPATCEAEGYTIYQYEYEGETYTVTVTLPVTEHQLNGEDMFYDDEHVYAVDNEYIFQTGNSAPACSSESFGQGYFYCDHCGQVIVINVRLPHERPEVAQNVTWDALPYDTIEEVVADVNSVIANNTIYTLNATCENVGYVVYRCAVCGEVQYEVLEVLGHDYVVTVSATPGASNTGLAVITCANGCGLNIEVSLPVLGSEDYEVVTISEASCNSVGVDRYTYVYNNAGEDIIITFDVVTPMTGHDLGEQIYTWEYEGMLYTAHLCGDCNRLIVESITPVE